MKLNNLFHSRVLCGIVSLWQTGRNIFSPLVVSTPGVTTVADRQLTPGYVRLIPGGLVLALSCFSAWAAPYDNLATALRQQLMINDLRIHCRIPANISDQQIKSAFLSDAENHPALLAAADALRMNNRERYAQQLALVKCPELQE